MPRSRRASVAAAVLLAGALALSSCGGDPVRPEPRETVHRTVTAILSDSLGAPSTYQLLYWTSEFDSAGLIYLIPGSTDEQGEDAQVLAEGPWRLSAWRAGGPGQVAGATLVVNGPERALVDTQVVRLTFHTPSTVSGTTTLAGRTDHSGIVVNCSGTYFQEASTDSAGGWTLDRMPLGRWTITMYRMGFKLGVATVDVVTPGSHITLPPVRLISNP